MTLKKKPNVNKSPLPLQLIDLKRQYLEYKKEIDTQIQGVINNSFFIMGPQVKQLEEQLAQYVGVKFAVGCSSGTDALLLALMSYAIQEGDEIITTPLTFISTGEVIAFLKAKPVFVDVNPETYLIDQKKIEKAITSKTRGIIAVDLYGQCANYDEINAIVHKYNLFVIEDAAQSFGAEYKSQRACSLADIACTSFFPAKPLGCYGDGGMIFTNDEEKANIMRSLRIHGMGKDKFDNVRIGLNARLDTLQAAVLLAKFKHLPKEIKLRNKVANYYNRHLNKKMITPKILNNNLSVFAQYCIRVPDRNALQKHLHDHDIPTAIHYPIPLHLQKAFSYLGHQSGDFPNAEKICLDILALPMHPFLKQSEQNFIIDTINSFYSA